MAKIIITFAEVRAASNLVATIIDAALENGVDYAVENRCKFVRKSEEIRNMSDEGVRSFFLETMNEAERKLVNVGYNDITVEVPEKFIIKYFAASEKFVVKAAPILSAMANLAKSFFNVVKAFEKDLAKLAKETFGS
ncbi:MAG: hypothetical protein PHQ58_05000 [Rhodoferax sp.]|uniref:hypothetical protein n=1 Tax=Rhodoferax sp. TaxID=50421 RepID=UPI0026295D83|nr:hypothetical protein [Rhodoferax sp.]MDD2879772.1 hypothetical protein [Rhodoferax sp.]